METLVSRRSFLKWGTVTAGTAGVVGFTGGASQAMAETDSADNASSTMAQALATDESKGEWLTGACMNNCSCGASRCLIKVYVEDGVPLKIRTDEESDDELHTLQRRACPRGRAKISDYLSPARIKYPMKRRSWSPEEPNGEMRGRDEWEKISWDEALAYIADEMQKELAVRGTRGMLFAGSSNIGDSYFDPMLCVFNALGGAVQPEMGTVSYGSWPVTETLMLGGIFTNNPHPLEMAQSELHIMFGCNWAANKAGNCPYLLKHCKDAGGKIIIIDPWLNQTAQALADEWIPIIPGTDTALVLGMAYHQIQNGLYDQAYLDTYTVGFDVDHMPEGMPPEMNFKGYVLGELDGTPKTPEWAEAICGVPADVIVKLAEEIGSTDKVNFTAGLSTTKIPNGEMFAQAFYTFALMHGGIGTPGHFMSSLGMFEGTAGRMSMGDYTNEAANPQNPLVPPNFAFMWFPIPSFDAIEDMDSWDVLDSTELWDSILNGEYGRDVWPGGKKKIDIHQIYFGGYGNTLNTHPNVNAGLKVVRQMDFVWGMRPWFDTSAQHCDIVLPCTTWWEKPSKGFGQAPEVVYWYDQIMEPRFEAKSEYEVVDMLAPLLGLDPKEVNTATSAERTYATVRDAVIFDEMFQPEPLFSITQEDLDELGVEGQPQEGVTEFKEFKEKGYYKYPRTAEPEGFATPFMMFYQDPEANPLNTTSGKFEICCGALAYMVNAAGFSEIAPIAMYQPSPEQGQGAQTEEYPLLLWTPHSLRRAHTVNDNVTSLREAFPQECFMSQVDADARGIKSGDAVLLTSPYGKVLRPVKVLPTIVPGAVAMEDGAWFQMDEASGIDIGGDPNTLQAPKTSGQACTPWTGTLVQVEKYVGDLQLVPDKERPLVLPVGIA